MSIDPGPVEVEGTEIPCGLAMTARKRVTDALPARAQDIARIAVDFASPSRRDVRREQRSAIRQDDPLARKLSPTGHVLAGAFAGMWMPPRSLWGGHLARLAGTYEEELVEPLKRMLALRPTRIIDIGASDGYYAVGLARTEPSIPVIAYELEANSRRICREIAKRNCVRNLKLRGRITPTELGRCLSPRAFVLCDVEGYEYHLLDPGRTPRLREASLLIELHESIVPGVTVAILERFEPTHNIDLIDALPREGSGRPVLAHLTVKEADVVVQEGRPIDPPMQWAAMTPKFLT
jgi:hypothetical protein